MSQLYFDMTKWSSAGILVDFLFHFTEKFYLDATQVMELINSDELENVSFKLAIYSDLV